MIFTLCLCFLCSKKEPWTDIIIVQEIEREEAMTHGWLKCQLFKGMFSDEVAVLYPPTSGTCAPSSFFVPKEEVEGTAGGSGSTAGRVSVRFFREGSTVWAILPAESQPVIQIDERDLTPVK